MVTTQHALNTVAAQGGKAGLRIGRHFTTPDLHPYDAIEWELRDAVIKDWKSGKVAFEQRDVEFPRSWSLNATTIVAQKYFRGHVGTPEREHSVRQMIDRVADTITGWGVADGYFADADSAENFNAELKHLLVNQMVAFNSPVWFNVGVEGRTPQCSACQPWDAPVSTPEGLIPIGRLVEENAVGAKVYDAHGLTKIVAVKHNGQKRVLRVHLKSGAYLDVTPDHLVWRALSGSGGGSFVEAGELRPGDRLEWHRTYAHGEGEITHAVTAEAALAGWLQSDGFVGQYDGTNQSLTIEAMTVNDAERDWVLAAIDKVLPGMHRKERTVATQDESLDCRRHRIYGEGLRDFVERWGLLARGAEMKLPDQLLTAPLPVVAAYLRSLFQAEGYVALRERSARIGLDMISEDVVRGVQALLLRFGIFSRVSFKRDQRENRHGCWSLSIANLGDRIAFRDEIGFIGETKAAKLDASLTLEGKHTSGTKTLTIAAIENRGVMDVYDIQTESGEYLSNNLRVHNCFILSVEDTMSSILNWYVEEGTIFKGGSGSGVNLSKIRSSKEKLSTGGTASGPVSFMRGADASAGTIKSGGATRRAAKMVILDVDHPDVEEFIWCKQREELKARALRDAGFDMDLDGLDSGSIQYQNANNSVRVTDEFMQAVLDDAGFDLKAVTTGETVKTLKARDLMRQIAQAAWECADPGMQYDTTINDWHTTPNAGRINGSNPCCFTGDTLVDTSAGLVRFDALEKMHEAGEELPAAHAFDRISWEHVERPIEKVWIAGKTTELVEVVTVSGLRLRCTPEHRFLTYDGRYIEAERLRPGQALRGLNGDSDHRELVEGVERCRLEAPITVYDLEVAGTHNFAVTTDSQEERPSVIAHNSEYMHLDNSACNLASLNLRKFERDGVFDVEAFRRAVEITFTAQEIIVGNSSYPTEKIAANARAYRQLGLGYANLGGLLMSQGLAYDSDEGRAWAGAITALMTGHAYRTSAELARVQGPFDGYAADRDGMLRVIAKHKDAAEQIDADLAPADILAAAKESWAEALELGTEHGIRNAQASVLAPTGCLVGGSLVPTERGLVRLASLGDPAGEQWQDLGVAVATDQGPKTATKFYVNGAEAVVTVATARGYRIQGTPRHRIKVVEPDGAWSWKRFADLGPGDLVPLALSQLVGGPQDVALPPLPPATEAGEDRHAIAPRRMSPELAELVGYFTGDGAVISGGLRLSVAANDFEVVEHLSRLGKALFNLEARSETTGGYTVVAFDSPRVAEWWQAVGFATGPSQVPDAVLATNDPEAYAAFLRGLFEADGTVVDGYPTWSTTASTASHDVQALLLALGFPTVRSVEATGWSDDPLTLLRLLNPAYNERWLNRIGFISERKNAAVAIGGAALVDGEDRIPLSIDLIERVAGADGRLRAELTTEHGRDGAVSRLLATRAFTASGDAELGRLLGFFFDTVASAELGGDELTYDLSVPDNVTYIANGFVSHNTIGLMMDCDTTGIEPDLGLVKSKKLVGGGTMRIVNQTVPVALKHLGYQPEQIEAILAYIDEHATIEGAPAFREEHLPVFDCAMGERSISPLGHVKMMSAVQPWISGAISKTANVPESATVEDIEHLFIEGWKLGLKALAIYRDNCKVAQPLSLDKKKAGAAPATEQEAAQAGMVRRRLPKQRPSQTISFQVGDAEGYLTAGEYPGDGLGEIFVKLGKQGSTLSGVMDAFAISVSLGLQYGVPLDAYVSKFTNMRFEPAGMTDDPEVKFASSIVDYIFRRLAIEYLPAERRQELGIYTIEERQASLDAGGYPPAIPAPPQEDAPQADAEGQTVLPVVDPGPVDDTHGDAPMCYQCGVTMVRAGSCHCCPQCGSTSGCS